jgi:uncharacterized protein
MLTDTPLTGDLQGCLVKPSQSNSWGVVILGGSSGGTNIPRARLFAEAGFVALAMRWFGGEGQVPGICEIPLETFTLATDRLLTEGVRHVAYVGTSKGAEAALLVAIRDPRIDLVTALSPTSMVWANSGVGRDGLGLPLRSSWTSQGQPLPFVGYDPAWVPVIVDGLLAYRSLFDLSLKTNRDQINAATIRIEEAAAEIILVAGEDDALWPSAYFARALAKRRIDAGRSAHLLIHPNAGHRIVFPGEQLIRSTQNVLGGTDLADTELGRHAWDKMLEVCLSSRGS